MALTCFAVSMCLNPKLLYFYTLIWVRNNWYVAGPSDFNPSLAWFYALNLSAVHILLVSYNSKRKTKKFEYTKKPKKKTTMRRNSFLNESADNMKLEWFIAIKEKKRKIKLKKQRIPWFLHTRWANEVIHTRASCNQEFDMEKYR